MRIGLLTIQNTKGNEVSSVLTLIFRRLEEKKRETEK